MKADPRVKLALLTGLMLGPVVGCPQNPFTQAVEFNLGQGLGEFEVTGSAATRQSRLVNLDTGGITLGSGSLEIDPEVITITPTDSGGGKYQVRLQGSTTLEISAWVAPPVELETVFETGDKYGPYSVTFDENLNPISVDPTTINLTAETIDLLNGGQFALGLEVISPIDGTVTIESLIFNLGL